VLAKETAFSQGVTRSAAVRCKEYRRLRTLGGPLRPGTPLNVDAVSREGSSVRLPRGCELLVYAPSQKRPRGANVQMVGLEEAHIHRQPRTRSMRP